MWQAPNGEQGKRVWPVADKPSRSYNISPNSKPLDRSKTQKDYFFLDQKLYRVLRADRPRDLLTAWDFAESKSVNFVLTEVKKKMRNAFDTVEVAQLLNRHRGTVQQYVMKGIINSPIRIYEKGKNYTGSTFNKMKWSEDDVLALHDYLLTTGGGRPRKDGTLYTAARLPTRRELLAMMRQQPMFYMKTVTGEFVPVWSAHDEV